MNFVTDCYHLSEEFPPDERFGLTSQLRRSAISVPSNIAEGAARKTRRDFLHHLYIARGSLAEARTQILVALQLGFLPSEKGLPSSLQRTFQLINAMIRKLESPT